MTIAKSVVYDGIQQRQLAQGDVLAGTELIPATDASANPTVTGAILLRQFWVRNPAAASNETIDTAANLVAAFAAAFNAQQIQNGTSFRFRWINISANALTVLATANTGIILNRGAIAANSAKEFLVTINNGTPAQVFAATTANASPNIFVTPAQAALLSVGMIVTSASAGLQGASIIAINQSSGQITMSANATSTNLLPGVAFTFSPVVQIDGLAP